MTDLRQMQEALRGMVHRVREASDGIVMSSGEIATGSMDLSARTERGVGQLQQGASIQGVPRVQGDAHAGRQGFNLQLRLPGHAAQGATQLVGDVQHLVQARTRADQGELLAAPAEQQVRLARGGGHGLGHGPQHLVALEVAVFVVDRLEEVQVDETQPQLSLIHI